MKNTIKTIFYIFIISILLKYLFNIYVPFQNINACKKSDSFFRYSKDTIDVIYLGASGVHNDISPIIIYKNFGITGFDVSSESTTLDLNYFQLKSLNINKRQDIKILILDMSMYFRDINENNKNKRNAIIHKNIDFYPANETKVNLLNNKKYDFSFSDKISYFIPFFSYHDKWCKPINEYFDFKNIEWTPRCGEGSCAGSTYNASIKTMKNQDYMKVFPNKVFDSYFNENYDSFEKIKNYCLNNNIKFILITSPDSFEWNKNKHDIIEKLAMDNNLEYIDFNTIYDKTKIDMDNDFWDGNFHLNINGQTKLSNYIGQYLKDNYNLEDHRGNPKYKQWDEDLEEYKKYEKIWFDEYNKNLQKQQLK